MKSIIIKTRLELQALDQEHPDFHSQFYDKYVQARREAGIPTDTNTDDNFIKYMVEDLDIGF